MDKTSRMIEELTPVLMRTAGRACIALAGAHAKGVQDDESDLDLYMIVEDPLPYPERLKIIESIADDRDSIYLSQNFDSAPYGGTMDFRFKGVPVETTVHTLECVERRVMECLEGEFEIIPQLWTTNGYYTFIYLSELDFIKIISDPNGTMARYKALSSPYPEKLRASIIDRFLRRSGTWLHNFHYDSAISRADIMFVGPIVTHTVLDMVQVIYALNRVYFHGDKKLAPALQKMPYCPAPLTANLEFLLSATSDREALYRQREILRSVHAELSEAARAPEPPII